MEETAYIIKQDGMPFGHTIRRRILDAGLEIAVSRSAKMTVRVFRKLYPWSKKSHIPRKAWLFNMIFNTTGLCEFGILRGEDAVAKLLLMAGTHSDPAKCEFGTLRRDFGISHASRIAGYSIHLKVLHRSKNTKEATRDLAVIRKLLGA